MIQIAVLMTCFNRQQKTLNCLQSLASQLQFSLSLQDGASAADSVQLTVYLLDNGDDGTFEAVASKFPWVRLGRGHADLYWNSGMRRVWQQAIHDAAATKPYDFYLWLNDDVTLASDALSRLLQSYRQFTPHAGALIGTMASPASLPTPLPELANPNNPVAPMPPQASYGGRQRRSRLNPLAFGPVMMPTELPQPCVFINGNLCLIPHAAVETIGLLSEQYSHGLGDFDYGLRLQQAGLTTYIAPGFYGECAVNPKAGSIFDPTMPFAQRLRQLQRPNVLPPNAEWRFFVRCHGGWVWPLLWLKSWGRQLFPALWLRLRQHKLQHQAQQQNQQRRSP